jgi:hypothetical protein
MALIAHWPLNGNTDDISGNNYNGVTPNNLKYTWYNTATWFAANSHPTTASGLDAFFNDANNGVTFGGTGFHNTTLNWSTTIGSKPVYLPADGYSWMVEGNIYLPTSGTYTFKINSDDASDIFIDGVAVSVYYGGHGMSDAATNTPIYLTKGSHRFRARFEEGGGGDGIIVSWIKPGDSGFSVIPASAFSTFDYVNGKIGQAASFNGSTSKVTTGNTVGNFERSDFSISFWVKMLTDGQNRGLICKSNGGNPISNYGFLINNPSAGTIGFAISSVTGAWGTDGSYSAKISGLNLTSNFVHFTLVAKRNETNVRMFINGIEQTVVEYVGGFNKFNLVGNVTNTLDFTIGAESDDLFSNSLINDVRVYNHALTDMEVQEIARAKILHYTFDDMQEPTTNRIPGANGINSYPNIGNSWGTYYTAQYNSNQPFSIGAIVSIENNIVTVDGTGRTIFTYDVLSPEATGGGVTAGVNYFIKKVSANQFTIHVYNGSQDGSQGYINPSTGDHKVFDSIALDQRVSISLSGFPTMWRGPAHAANSALVKEIIPNITNPERYNDHSFIRLHFDHKAGAVDGGMAYGVLPTTDAGKRYSLSCYVRAANPATIGKTIYVTMYNVSAVSGWGIIGTYTFTSMNWVRIQGSAISPGTGYTNASNFIYFWPSNGSTIDVSEIQFEEKAYASEFTLGSRTGQVNDYSGYFTSANLLESTTPRWVPISKTGTGAYDFNGTNNKIESTNIPFTNSKDDFTVSLWVNPDTVATGTGLGNRFISWGDPSGRFFFGNYQGAISLGTGNITLSPSGYTMTAGSWQHFAVSNAGSSTKFYKNGQLIQTLTNTSTADISSSLPFRIGAQYGNGEGIEFFDGEIEDVRIYKTALSDKDILDLYNTRAEIEQSGVLYARDFLSNAEPVVNILSYAGDTRSELSGNHGTSTTFKWDIEQKVRVGEEYVFSAEFFRNILHDGRIYAMFRLEDSNGVLIPGNSGLIPGWAATVAEPLYKYFQSDIKNQADGKWFKFSLPKITIPAGYDYGTIRWIQFVITTSPTDSSFITRIRKPQFEKGSTAKSFAETFRQVIELPSTLSFSGDEVHETGTANFEDFSTVGITDGLIGYWPLNGSAIDYSGNNYNGTVSGALAVSGLNDRAYSFDGVDDYISTDLSIKNVDKTISFLIKKNGASTAGAVINQWYSPASWLVYTVPTSGFIRYYSHNGSATDTITSTISVCDNAWHHVAMTYTSSNNLLSIYIDGTFNISKNLTVEEATTSSNGLWIGRENGPIVYNPLQGILDEIKIFNRSLTAEEVAIEYNTMFNNEVQIHEDGVVYAKDIIQY